MAAQFQAQKEEQCPSFLRINLMNNKLWHLKKFSHSLQKIFSLKFLVFFPVCVFQVNELKIKTRIISIDVISISAQTYG
jgi:hypothetical protein